MIQRALASQAGEASIPSLNQSSALEACFESELAAAHPDLWRHYSIDGMWIIEASAPTEDAVQAAGLAVFWGRDSRTYLAPFELAATLALDRRSLASYEIRFGVRGERTRLALVPYSQESIVRSRMLMFRPRNRRDWAFVVMG